MNESKLKKLYNEASTKKLTEMFKKAIELEKTSNKLQAEAESITDNITATVRHRFEKISSYTKHSMVIQVEEMSKQWGITAASMIRVKRSVELPNFHSKLRLYINSKYGIKEYKRCSRYTPFTYFYGDGELEHVVYKNSRLIMESIGYELDFVVLQGIPQLDQERVKRFMEITKETVSMINSWRNFYKTRKNLGIDTIEEMESIKSYNGISDNEKYLKGLINLDDLLLFKQKLSTNTILQAARWDITINKWKAINKSFLVLNELTNTKLKI